MNSTFQVILNNIPTCVIHRETLIADSNKYCWKCTQYNKSNVINCSLVFCNICCQQICDSMYCMNCFLCPCSRFSRFPGICSFCENVLWNKFIFLKAKKMFPRLFLLWLLEPTWSHMTNYHPIFNDFHFVHIVSDYLSVLNK